MYNYAQVTEIRNDSENKIRELESQTNKKIGELNVLFESNKSITKEIKNIERNTYFISGESYRLFALYTLDKNHYKVGTAHLINALSNYIKSGKEVKFINTILEIVIDNLKPENWNHEDSTEKIDYDELITMVRELPDKYTEKKDILKKLEDYKAIN
jgi:hypothetical protein